MGALLDIQVTLDVNISVELSGDAHIAVPFQLTLDAHPGTENGFVTISWHAFPPRGNRSHRSRCGFSLFNWLAVRRRHPLLARHRPLLVLSRLFPKRHRNLLF